MLNTFCPMPILHKEYQSYSHHINLHPQIMFAIASIADCVGDLLSPFYNQVMPIIKSLYIHPPITMNTLTDPADVTIYRANALECITCVGAAVGGTLLQMYRHHGFEPPSSKRGNGVRELHPCNGGEP